MLEATNSRRSNSEKERQKIGQEEKKGKRKAMFIGDIQTGYMNLKKQTWKAISWCKQEGHVKK